MHQFIDSSPEYPFFKNRPDDSNSDETCRKPDNP